MQPVRSDCPGAFAGLYAAPDVQPVAAGAYFDPVLPVVGKESGRRLGRLAVDQAVI
jgi:hypothetical protein